MPQKPATNQTPLRSPSQRMDALKRANKVRSERAQLKRELKEGKLDIKDVLENPPEFLKTAKVIDILLGVPKLGRVKAEKILLRCRISQAKTIGGLSERQRSELHTELLNRPGAR